MFSNVILSSVIGASVALSTSFGFYMVYFPYDLFVPKTTTLRSSSKLLYCQPFAHTNAFFHSFVPKTCSVWNNLPDYITHANTLSVFKSSLVNHMYHIV